jgi:HK97 family phage major capsid protein
VGKGEECAAGRRTRPATNQHSKEPLLANCARDYRLQLQARVAHAKHIFDNAAGRGLSAGEYATVEGILQECRAIKGRLDDSLRDRELRNSLDDLGRLDASNNTKENTQLEDSAYDLSFGKGEQSVTDALLEAPQFKQWYRGIAPSGTISESTKGIGSPPVQMNLGLKTLLTGASGTSAGAMVFPETAPFVGPAGRRELTLRDLISIVPTASDQVQFAKFDTETNAAASVPEATATGGTTGTKPESAMAFTTVTVNVRTFAHWIPVTKRAFADAPQLRALVDQSLLHGLAEELEDQMLTGGGTGEDFTGLSITSSVQTQGFVENNMVTCLKGRTKVRTVGRARPTAYLMNPADVENLLLWRDTQGHFMLSDPAGGNPYTNVTLWGLPVVQSEGIPAGTGYVGDFKELFLFDRQAAEISVSDSHADMFVRNMLAVLAEVRAGFCVRRPPSLVKLTLSLGGS